MDASLKASVRRSVSGAKVLSGVVAKTAYVADSRLRSCSRGDESVSSDATRSSSPLPNGRRCLNRLSVSDTAASTAGTDRVERQLPVKGAVEQARLQPVRMRPGSVDGALSSTPTRAVSCGASDASSETTAMSSRGMSPWLCASCEQARCCCCSQSAFTNRSSARTVTSAESRGGPSPTAHSTALAEQKSATVREGRVRFCALFCKYSVVTKVAKERGWLLVYGNPDRGGERVLQNCNVYWIDNTRLADVIRWVEPWVMVNHFPGMNDILGRKSGLAQHLRRMQKAFPGEYNFFPPTWVLPSDLIPLKSCLSKSRSFVIVKPDRGSRGRGIFITQEFDKVRTVVKALDEILVAQRYIAEPMLLDGLKFDLRLYVLVGAVMNRETGALDLRVFLFRDGLVRLCTSAYRAPTLENEDEQRMHLTNYAVNKSSANFGHNVDADDDGTGSKRSLRWLLAYFEEHWGRQSVERLWASLCDLCAKTCLMAQPGLEMEYHSKFPQDLSACHLRCRSFELLGFDVMLDARREPWLIEVNCLPSFGTDTPLDEDIKKRAISQSLDIACADISTRDRATYRCNAHRRRCGQEIAQRFSDATAPPSPGCHGGSADVTSPVGDGSSCGIGTSGFDGRGECRLDKAAYKDFVRILPPPADAALGASYETMLDRARTMFRPVGCGAVCDQGEGNASVRTSTPFQRSKMSASGSSVRVSSRTSRGR
eukprot:TRINITY_DN67890_c0_g1_i1.p1 TRINITY_DN67890_c0_g1~~TRINITY_DN67890_c0_g1_i1.p1  ORF type:complete len:827 (+),score=102.22 TRINITY_DN67890_c0_g1_i1:349-2481(+)